MTDVTENQGRAEADLSAADEQVLRELTERARTGGLKLTGQGGLLGQLTKMIVEGALEGELDDHLGYGKHDPEGRDGVSIRKSREWARRRPAWPFQGAAPVWALFVRGFIRRAVAVPRCGGLRGWRSRAGSVPVSPRWGACRRCGRIRRGRR